MSARLEPSWQHWSASELEVVRRMAEAGFTAKAASLAIGRPFCAVRCKAMREGIRFPRKGWRQAGPGMPRRRPDNPNRKAIEASKRLRDAIKATGAHL